MSSPLEHFSHEHPLIFNEEKDIEDEINRDHFCCICSLPILLSSSYSCSVTGCQYLLHEPCALLPRQIENPWNSGTYLQLARHEETTHYCTRCHQECKNLHYCGRQRSYDYHLHPTCGAPMEIKSKHKSHTSHPLLAVCRETLARCDACGLEQKGRFFSCHKCDFWLHMDCAVLPRFVKCTKHRHPLVLSYSIYEYAYDALSKCIICDEKIFEGGAYLCGECKGYAHLRCVADNIEDLGTETIIVILDLPYDDLDALWSWMRKKLQKMKLDVGKPTYDYNYRHEHSVLLYDHGADIKNSTSAEPYVSQESACCCNVCIQPIFPPFFACPQSQSDEGGDFHIHQQCSEILARASYPKHKPKESLCSLFYCRFCGIPSNGLIYYFASNIKDISCLCAPRFIKHESHRQHVLYHFDVRYRFDKGRTLNCCSTPDKFWYAYACVDCGFAIHVHCALLPKRVEHRFDVHPLTLITTCSIANKDTTKYSSDYFCEFCEEDIDTRFWYYGCEECNNLFHIKCIPSLGYLSRVKFGNSIAVPCHPHGVTFVRMLGFGSQTCGYCKEIIQGFVDDMAFQCSECDFWMHFECAEECTGTEKFNPGERTIR